MDPVGGLKRLAEDFGLQAIVATEIEFYLHGAGPILPEADALLRICDVCAKNGLALARAEKERGPDQFEVSFLPTRDVDRMKADTARFKALMTETFAPLGLGADFAAKPLRDAPGSGLHVHVHLEDASGRNVFFRDAENFSPALLHALGGLLALMNPCMPVFAPRAESYDRFAYTANAWLACPTLANVPLTASWGVNNRTAALRLPNKPTDNKHIEHRVAGSDADAGKSIEAILAGIHYGLLHACDPGPPVYGDAALPQYGLPRLAASLEEAEDHARQCAALGEYF